ncbi:PepSY domain-containing protein [Mesorhizobium sp. Mes31]|uniref:PepSY domain-containing protein n=1 Tax=Mesorhizobium sp. Mes31 TaxID=2926017 RepID=UPI002119574F|nr:PepSY domain-containing protein [Mesorhizobium sp. Mes31]
MIAKLKRLMVMGLIGLALVLPLAALADEDDDGDHDRARDLYEHGEIKGLAKILDIVRAQTPGDVVAVDLIRLGDKWVYRFQIIVADGRRKIVDVDADAAVIIRGGEGD